jgi:hypothetical protein
MTTGELLYLLLAVGSTTALALVLAYYSWQQAKADRRKAAPAAQAQSVPPPAGARLA